MTAVEVALSPYRGNTLGFDVLAGRRWCLPGGRVWRFRSREAEAMDREFCKRLPRYHPPNSLVFLNTVCPVQQDGVLLNYLMTLKGLSWFNPSRQLSTTQPLAHSPHPVGWGRELEKKSKTRGLR